MKAITYQAPQSRKSSFGRSAHAENLTLEQTSFKSAFKSQARRQWLRGNLALRTWSRNTTAKYGNVLLWVMSIAAIGGFVSAIFENDALTAIFALVAMAAMTPEMTMQTYEPLNDEIC